MPYIGTCFRFYMQMRVEKKTKHLHIEYIVTSHNSVHTLKSEGIFCNLEIPLLDLGTSIYNNKGQSSK